ncbi:nibrin homolog isoform X2 [Andrographis paniculata]|uniref:nibrin homolog isoform X2 n=1 Tax=Andrographis paniculata TaxID=175694 RepID=UPI0021E94598|nr:nibrin homolog isoform X2 [Andrographis paniculata]
MVWGLFPVDPFPGEDKYYIFKKGTYKVGRKGCDIIVNKDKGVSRVHAEIIVDEMICMDNLQKRQLNNFSKVRIRDCSKYGTFINQNAGSKEKVHEFPDKETMLKSGDLVSFGTGNAIYRFSFVPLLFCVPSCGMNQLEQKFSLIGAHATQTWTSKCTHLVIEDSVLINNEVIDAIVARKPVVGYSWIELIAEKTICTEMPSLLLHSPAVIVDGVTIKVTDSQSREQCLKGYTFLLQPIEKYKFNIKFPELLKVCGANVVETQDQCRQNPGDNLVYVMPSGSEGLNNVNNLPKVKEMELIAAVISGHLDPAIVASAPVLVTSSCSTDETVVADSDVELETATSIPAPNVIEHADTECHRKMEIHKIQSSENDSVAESEVHIVESDCEALKATALERPKLSPPNRVLSNLDDPSLIAAASDNDSKTWSRGQNEEIMLRKDRENLSESENLDIIYSEELIVRASYLPQSVHSSSSAASVNFKCFRKRNLPSGNSFSNLIPFSKYPYEESDYGNESVAESVKEEKKRKQMEAIAEDLFNNEKVENIHPMPCVLTPDREKAWQIWFPSRAFCSWLVRRRAHVNLLVQRSVCMYVC